MQKIVTLLIFLAGLSLAPDAVAAEPPKEASSSSRFDTIRTLSPEKREQLRAQRRANRGHKSTPGNASKRKGDRSPSSSTSSSGFSDLNERLKKQAGKR